MPLSCLSTVSSAHRRTPASPAQQSAPVEALVLRDSLTNNIIQPSSTDALYSFYTFTENTYIYSTILGSVSVLLVGGGGSGGSYADNTPFSEQGYYPGLGGGGGGEVVVLSSFTLQPNEHYELIIGEGGSAANGTNGSLSSIAPFATPFNKRVAGGGGAGGTFSSPTGKNGGSGGGAVTQYSGVAAAGTGVPTYDLLTSFVHDGGSTDESYVSSGSGISRGGGGGGASSPGLGFSDGRGGSGYVWIDGQMYGAGGGGGQYIPPGTLYDSSPYGPIAGGNGGGGSGAGIASAANAGSANYGSGGGGANRLFLVGGNGGRGVIKVAVAQPQ